MKASTLTPAEIFGNQIRYVVPLYQRPYVWSKDEQWQPLWDDVVVVAERFLTEPHGYGSPAVSPHFLGAIVIDHLPGPVSHIQARSVIDGQQRLTTMQLLLDAAYAVVKEHGRPVDASALRVLVENDSALAIDPDHVFKVWPTDRDQDAYRHAMRDDLIPAGEHRIAAIGKGHAFFEAAVREWARIAEDPVGVGERLSALTVALREKLRLVVIDLEPGDNAQVIFETLNHRGSPLLAADLIKNLMFQVAAAQGLDVQALYSKHWRALDDDYWRQKVAQGRRFMPRIDVFIQRWLVMMLKRDVPVDRVFTEFRDNMVSKPDVDIAVLFAQLADDARVHRGWDSLPETSVTGRFFYRVLTALDNQVVAPVFLWLTHHEEAELPVHQRDRALQALESWLVRRALIRATTKDYNNAVIDMLRALEQGGPAVAGDTLVDFLSGQSAESRYWPNDDRLAQVLGNERLYKTMTRPRLRMILEALEDDARGPLGEGQTAPRGLTIEHVMPVAWREHWSQGVADDPIASEHRDGLIHSLGNLTLVTGRLNPTLSNRPWTDAEASTRGLGLKGKRDYLLQHSQLSLNAALVHQNPDAWGEEAIRGRTQGLLRRISAIWTCPNSAVQSAGRVVTSAPHAVGISEEEPEWGVDRDSVADAARLWLSISTTSRRLIEVLLAEAPDKILAPDLARRLELDSGPRGVAGLLARPAQVVSGFGRPLPVLWEEGEPSRYWIDLAVAQTLEAGAQLATSTDFIAENMGAQKPAPPAGETSRRPGGAVPDHIREVFDALPVTAALTVREIAKRASSNYEENEISHGAISASINSGGAAGFEWVPDSSPRRIQRVSLEERL